MLETRMGDIEILINGEKTSYKAIKLKNIEKQFLVNGRFKVIVDNLPYSSGTNIIECKIVNFKGDDREGCIESGERLALISFYHENLKLSIGVEDEVSDIFCNYIDCGLQVIVSNQSNVRQIVFGISWIFIQDTEKEDIYTWFAADPTQFEK